MASATASRRKITSINLLKLKPKPQITSISWAYSIMTSSFAHSVEEKKQIILHDEFQRKLNLNVPLLSTKRPYASEKTRNPPANSNVSSPRVPFSWERTAGEPKDKSMGDILGNIIDIPLPPKPPPGRWQPPPPVVMETKTSNGDESYDHECVDDEHDENDDCCRDNGCLSDTIDIFSLAESVDDDVEENFRQTKDNISSDNDSTSFIIQRFLPDAQALAAAYVMNGGSVPDSDDSSFARTISIRRSCHSPKGCGLGSLFPFQWRMKPKSCGLKSPIREPKKKS